MASVNHGQCQSTLFATKLQVRYCAHFMVGYVFIDIFEGCKDFVIVHPDERHLLNATPLAGAQIWQDDFFSHGRPASMKRIWRGMVHPPGETLYFPGDALHEARNQCPNTLSACTRPWHGAEMRKLCCLTLYEVLD